MKKYIAAFVCVLLLVSVTACNTQKEEGPATSATQTTVITTAGEGSTTATTTMSTTTAGDTTAEPSVDSDEPTGGDAPTTTAPVPSQTTSASTFATVSGTTSAGTQSTASTTAPVTSATKPISTTTTTVTTQPTVPQPAVILPAIGSDIDVQKQKNRIRVSAASAAYNADGSIAVSLTFQNHTSNWITEETDWVEYTCYDKNGNVVQAATKLHIGCIDTKKNPVRTYTFTVPAATAEVRLTNCKIVYWTEWV